MLFSEKEKKNFIALFWIENTKKWKKNIFDCVEKYGLKELNTCGCGKTQLIEQTM